MPDQAEKRDIRINDAQAPASSFQKSLIDDLAKAEVVSQAELAALGDTPTKQQAHDLIEAHSGEDAFKAVQEARRSERAAARAAARTERSEEPKAQGDENKAGFANVNMPAAFLTPHTFEAKDGRNFEKAYVSLPIGVKVNGVELGGYSCDVFMNDRMKQQMLSGGQVTLSFKADEPVQVWTGKKGDEQHPYKRFEVGPWDLVRAVKAEQEGFKEARAAERASLSQEAEQARSSSGALEGREQAARPEPTR